MPGIQGPPGPPGPPGPAADTMQPYRLVAPVDGGTVSVNPEDELLVLNSAATLAALTVNLPTGVDQKQITIATRQRIDLLTVAAFCLASVDWTPNELPQEGKLRFVYVAPMMQWVRA